MDLKHFRQDGRIYKIKPNYIFPTVIIIGLILLSALFYVVDFQLMIWIFLSLAILVFLGFRSEIFEIDPISKTITRKQGLVRPKSIVSFDDIIEFEMISTAHTFIRTNSALVLYYHTADGNEKMLDLYQGFTKRVIQEVLNDIEKIIEDERN